MRYEFAMLGDLIIKEEENNSGSRGLDNVGLVSVGGELLISVVVSVGMGMGDKLAPDIHFDQENTANEWGIGKKEFPLVILDYLFFKSRNTKLGSVSILPVQINFDKF